MWFPENEDPPDARETREEMVRQQLEPRSILDKRVLEAFRYVPRHLFCENESSRRSAYGDHPCRIGEGQTISQPYIVARMTEMLRLKGDERVLEVGGGSGYQAAILAYLAERVVTIERQENLADALRAKCEKYNIDNVRVVTTDGTKGFAEEAPYDAIIVTAAAPDVPEPLKKQLNDGGRIVIPVGSKVMQRLEIVEREGNEFHEKQHESCCFVPLLGEYGW